MTSAMPVIGSSAYLKLARHSELMVQLFSLNDALEFELRKYNKCLSLNDALEFESRKYNKCLSFYDAHEFEFKIWQNMTSHECIKTRLSESN